MRRRELRVLRDAKLEKEFARHRVISNVLTPFVVPFDANCIH